MAIDVDDVDICWSCHCCTSRWHMIHVYTSLYADSCRLQVHFFGECWECSDAVHGIRVTSWKHFQHFQHSPYSAWLSAPEHSMTRLSAVGCRLPTLVVSSQRWSVGHWGAHNGQLGQVDFERLDFQIEMSNSNLTFDDSILDANRFASRYHR